MKNKYFTENERYQLEALLKQKVSVAKIAAQMNKSRTTIYNEIKRGTVKQYTTLLEEKNVYLADYAQRDYMIKASNKGRSLAIGNDLRFIKYAEKMMLEEKYSPYAILEKANENGMIKNKICLSTFYNYLRSGLFLNIKFNAKLKKSDQKRTVSLKNTTARSINERPDEANNREQGHWEMDTVVSGKKGKGCLLVLTERCSRKEIIKKMKDKSAKSVVKALNQIERSNGSLEFRKMFKTITCDNGTEFSDMTGIEKSYCSNKKRTTLYYCHPYCASERGSNENQNRLIRKFIPKGSDISSYSTSYINYIENWINTYPRKLFKGLSSNQIYEKMSKSSISC